MNDSRAGVARVRPRLVLHRPDSEPLDLEVSTDAPVTVGRDANNTIALDSSFVSKLHAVMTWTGGSFLVSDQGSSNGTKLNGQPIREGSFFPGDTIEFGDQRIEWLRDVSGSADPGRMQSPASKTARLMIAALVTLIVVVGILMVAANALLPSSDASPESRYGQLGETDAALPPTLPAYDSPEARAIASRATASKGVPADWIYDEAVLEYRSRRLLQAIRLFAGVLYREPTHPGARRQLSAALIERDLEIRRLHRDAERAVAAMHIDDAVRAWEAIADLTEVAEPVHKAAIDAVAVLRARRSGNP